MPEGNVAFKVTWVYGPTGPFTAPCEAEGREINVVRERKVWCSDGDCECARMVAAGNTGRLPADSEPCYDAAIFREWSFGGGIYHNGKRRGQPMSINHVQPGKLAFFTSKRFDMAESDRVVIGCFEIAESKADPEWGIMITSLPESRVRVNNVSHAPRYWDFHKQNGPPRWGTGLFRYIPDSEARRLHEAVKAFASTP